MTRTTLVCMTVSVCAAVPTAGALTLVEEGKPRAALILPVDATPTEQLAAEELVWHLRAMSGVGLPVREAAQDDAVAVYLGSSAAAVGVDVTGLTPEHYRLVTGPNWLAIAGKDGSSSETVDDPLNLDIVQTGTLFGVYHLLDNVLGVRWLWPGEGGTFVPKRATVTIPDLDVTAGPKLLQRRFRHHRSRARRQKFLGGVDGLTRTEAEVADRLDREECRWLRRQRQGRRESFAFGHSFTRWWGKYGETHPEYFATVPGRKQPFPNTERPKLCVSNPAVTDQIIADWQAAGANSHLAACPNDSRAFCTCENCRKWDLPVVTTPENVDESVLTYRYVKFWQILGEKVAAINPDVFVCGYAYSNYRQPPDGVKLSSNVFLGYVGGMGKEAIDEWQKWSDTGVKLYFRPNWFHAGHNAPYLPLHEAGEFLKFANDHSMLGTDFDSLLGHYSTHGPWYYVAARCMARPDLSVEQIIDEYCDAFGPAAGDIRQYLDYWEKHTAHYREQILEHSEEFRGGPRAAVRLMPDVFTDEVLAPAEQLLFSALAKLAGEQNAEYASRVRFLQEGLKHTRVTRDAVAFGDKVGSVRGIRENAMNAVKAAKALVAYRKTIEDSFVDWPEYTTMKEITLGDFTGIRLAAVLGDRDPVAVLPAAWYFQWDPDDVGEKERWFALDYEPRKEKWPRTQVYRWWERNDIGRAWREAHDGKDYDGVAWYRTRFEVPAGLDGKRLKLLFGAVDESCKVWLNGKLVGEHPFVDPDDWKTPFEFDVTDHLTEGTNHVAVRVVDEAGMGGIWKLVWLVAE